MKKLLAGIMSAVGVVTLGVGVVSMTKKVITYSITGADGPTAVFVAGKFGNGFAWAITAVGTVLLGTACALFVSVRKKGTEK